MTMLEYTEAAFNETLVYVKKGVGYDVYRAAKFLGHVKKVGTVWGIYSKAHGSDVICHGTAKTRETAARHLTII
jgi:hypothetical protein